MKSLTRLQFSPQYGFWTPAFAGVTEKGIRTAPASMEGPNGIRFATLAYGNSRRFTPEKSSAKSS